jgi:hypothetical protein
MKQVPVQHILASMIYFLNNPCQSLHIFDVIVRSYFTRLVFGTSRTVSSAKKFVRITSGFGGGELKIEICFFTARILQNQSMLCCGECFHD